MTVILKPFYWARLMKKRKLVLGIGINDSDYQASRYELVSGVRKRVWACPFYRAWSNMLNRCYSGSYQKLYPTYSGCEVIDEWRRLSSFTEWMRSQLWDGAHLDKDILSPGNKVYGPDKCVFISASLNIFLIDSGASRGEWPIGVHWVARDKAFQSSCRNPFTDKQESLGLFACPVEAHKAWRNKKHQHACRYADMQTDPRIAEALRNRYIENKDYSNAVT